MDVHTFRRLGAAVFGPQWKGELARLYSLSPRMIRYMDAGDFHVRHDIAADLLTWSEPEGWKDLMTARLRRAVEASVPNGRHESAAFKRVFAWAKAELTRSLREAEARQETDELEYEDRQYREIAADVHEDARLARPVRRARRPAARLRLDRRSTSPRSVPGKKTVSFLSILPLEGRKEGSRFFESGERDKLL